MLKWKKLLALAAALMLAAALLLAGYIFVGLNWHYLFDLRSSAEPLTYSRPSLTVHAAAEGVRAETRDAYAEFSRDRALLHAEGVTPIPFDRRSLWGVWSYEDFVAEYGTYHVDLGYNAFEPSWFTTDGYLISLWFGGGEKLSPLCISNIGEVRVYDLLAVPADSGQ